MKTFAATSDSLSESSGSDWQDIREIKGPIEIPDTSEWLLWISFSAALAFLAYWAWRRLRKQPEQTVRIIAAAHEQAREQLHTASALIHKPRPFCTLISDAIRAYLEERFNFRAPDRTTEEFLDELKDSDVLTIDQKQSLGEFLIRCDLVKFAPYEPAEPELRVLLEAAMRLIDETQPPPLAPDMSGRKDLNSGPSQAESAARRNDAIR